MRAHLATLAVILLAAPASAAPKAKPMTALDRVGIMIAVARFVERNCSYMAIDYEVMAQAVRANGVSAAEVQSKQVAAIASDWNTRFYRGAVGANCIDLRERFGPGGSTLPGLITPPH